MISDALDILHSNKYVDFSFEDLTFAIEQAERDVMDYEDYQRMN